MKLAIIYGIGEGPALTKKFRRALSAMDIHLTTDLARADIIVTHSGGVTELPKDTSGQLILIVAPSYGTAGHSIARLSWEKVRMDFRYLRRHNQTGGWAVKTLINAGYLMLQLPRAVRMYQFVRRAATLLPHIKSARTIVALYREDPWSRLITPAEKAKFPAYSFIEVPGSHDDLWTAPKSLAMALQSALRARY
jgi:hypothetical protein